MKERIIVTPMIPSSSIPTPCINGLTKNDPHNVTNKKITDKNLKKKLQTLCVILPRAHVSKKGFRKFLQIWKVFCDKFIIG